jgi:hypothetical protein
MLSGNSVGLVLLGATLSNHAFGAAAQLAPQYAIPNRFFNKYNHILSDYNHIWKFAFISLVNLEDKKRSSSAHLPRQRHWPSVSSKWDWPSLSSKTVYFLLRGLLQCAPPFSKLNRNINTSRAEITPYPFIT